MASRLELRFKMSTIEPQRRGQSSRPGSGAQIIARSSLPETFRDLDYAMVILGEAGSGKTTLLKELLRDLLSRAADSGPDGIIPIFLPLASWALRREPIEQWVTREVSERHDIPPRHIRGWLEQEQIALLLDGLDEVAPTHRADCVNAINTFRRANGTTVIAVCCRTGEYSNFREPLALRGSAIIQPLDRREIERYLDRSDDSFALTWAALSQVPGLSKMVNTPLILNILVRAFPETVPSGNLSGGASQELLNTLFAQYVPAMLRQRASADQMPRRTIRRLAFLARQLERGEQVAFTWDMLDSSSLPERWWVHALGAAEWLLRMTVSVLIMGIVAGALLGWPGAVVGGIAGLLANFSRNLRVDSIALAVQAKKWPWEIEAPDGAIDDKEPQSMTEDERRALYQALTSVLSGGELSSFIDLVIGEPTADLRGTLMDGSPEERLKRAISSVEFMTLLMEAPEAELEDLMAEVVPKEELLRRLDAYQREEHSDREPYVDPFMSNELDELSAALTQLRADRPQARLRIAIVSLVRHGARALDWWLKFRQDMHDRSYYVGDLSFPGLLAVLIISITAWVILGWPYAVATAPSGFAALTFMTVVDKPNFRFSARRPEWSFPSPGLRAILKVCIIAVPLIALLAGVIAGVIAALAATVGEGTRFAVAAAASAAAFAVMCLGGAALIEQARIRLALQWADLMPLRSRSFLRYATQCLLLQQSGQEYMFSHGSLQEFFAGLCPPDRNLAYVNEPDFRLVGMLVPTESHSIVHDEMDESDLTPLFEEQLSAPALAVARTWYANAAIKGDKEAQYRLGVLLVDQVQPSDLVGAREWLTRAAEAGHIEAQRFLAHTLANQPDPSPAEARDWLTRAAEAGDSEAQSRLGQLLENLPEPDITGAYTWYKEAARAGNADAAFRLGRFLEHRLNPPNYLSARMWYRRAAKAGHTEAPEALKRLGG